MTNQYKIGNLLIVAPGKWKDITDELDEPAAPFTLAKDLGVLRTNTKSSRRQQAARKFSKR